jgi:hypothetical protein
VYEYDRLVKMGQKGIGSKLTPEFIDAVRRMDELEGLVEPRQISYEAGDVRLLPPEQRLAIEAQRASVAGGQLAIEPPSKKTRTDQAAGKGLLSGSALDSLKKAAALRKAKQQKAAVAAAKASS